MAQILNDENFETEIAKSAKPVLVDFFAEWCEPCAMIGPVLEKIADEYKEKLVLAKVNLDASPLTSQKFQISRIPTIILFNNGQPVTGFSGARPEDFIKEWLDKFLDEIAKSGRPAETNDNESKTQNLMKEYREYARQKGIKLNPDEQRVKRIIGGLFANEAKYGYKYCPCRRITGNKESDAKNICPCHYHLDEVKNEGHCVCGLFIR